MKIAALICLIFTAFHAQECQALSDTDSMQNPDTIVDTGDDLKRIYKVWIRMTDGKRKSGYLYSIHASHITICNRNPKNMDSAELSKLELLSIPDSLIKKINLRRNNQVNAAVGGLMGVSALAGILAYATYDDKDQAAFFYNDRWGAGLLAAYVVLTFPAIPVIAIAYIPKSYRIRGNKSAYTAAIYRISRKTHYKVRQ